MPLSILRRRHGLAFLTPMMPTDLSKNLIDYPLYQGLQFRMQLRPSAPFLSPFLHVRHGAWVATIYINTGEVLAGSLTREELRITQTWIVLHWDELITDWKRITRADPERRTPPMLHPYSLQGA